MDGHWGEGLGVETCSCMRWLWVYAYSTPVFLSPHLAPWCSFSFHAVYLSLGPGGDLPSPGVTA